MKLHRVLRLVGAVLLLAGGGIHLQLLLDGYGTEGIGRAFVVNAGLSALVAAFVVLRTGAAGPIAGIAVSFGSLIALALTRSGDGILGFREQGLEPAPHVMLTVLFEGGAIVALIVALALRSEGRHRRRHRTAA